MGGNGKEEKEGSVAQRRGPSGPWGLSLSCDRRDLSSRLRGQGGSEPHLPAEPPTTHSREEVRAGESGRPLCPKRQIGGFPS